METHRVISTYSVLAQRRLLERIAQPRRVQQKIVAFRRAGRSLRRLTVITDFLCKDSRK
jgi:hypothetical protein